MPEDEREQVEIAVLMKNGGLASLKTAVAKAQQLEGEFLDHELEEIEKEKAQEQFTANTDDFFPGDE